METTKFLTLAGLQHLITKLYARGFNGMGLSQENFTSAMLAKLNSTATTEGMSEINGRLAAVEALIAADKDGAINKFNEIVAFLNGIEDTATLAPVLADVAANKGAIAALPGQYVAKETGKGLSTNDYDAAAVAEVAKVKDKANAADVYTKTAADAAFQPKGDYQPAGDYLTEHQSLAGYAKTSDYAAITDAEIDAILAAE